jgi:hypothetical protein
MSSRRANWVVSFAGVAAALLAAECALRLFATGATLNGLPTGETYKQFSEGIATSHFRSDTSRETGNPILSNAPNVLILGDSHVPAVQIEDGETMGAVLERLARSKGMPLNVRQFGWSGQGYGIARTLALGPELAARFNAERVVVVLSEGALRTYPEDPAAAAQLADEAPPSVRNLNALERIERNVAHYSVLVHLLYVRAREEQGLLKADLLGSRPDEACIRRDGDARSQVIANLQRAFGDRLLVLYAPDVGLDTPDTPDCWEALLLPQCRQSGVQCVSLRARMLAARRAHILVRGFDNTRLGVGHLNRAGHELAARTLFEDLQPQLASRH